MKILIYSFNDKIGDGLQKVSFLQEIKRIYPNSHVTYTTTITTTTITIITTTTATTTTITSTCQGAIP